jgi:NAD(P)H-flavin reductase
MAIVKKYPATVFAISNYVNGVYTLELESLEKPFKYEPGQFLHLTVDEYDPAGQWPDSRCFSIQSNPSEKNIRITFSVKGKYTRRMEQTLQKGSKVWLKLPFGNLFSQLHKKENTVFIAGGTGITPFLSLFTHESFNQYNRPHIYLGFRSRLFNIYNEELSLINSIDINIQYEDINGIMDINQIFKKNGTKNSYLISGPPTMIKQFRQHLISHGVPLNNVLTDEWE